MCKELGLSKENEVLSIMKGTWTLLNRYSRSFRSWLVKHASTHMCCAVIKRVVALTLMETSSLGDNHQPQFLLSVQFCKFSPDGILRMNHPSISNIYSMWTQTSDTQIWLWIWIWNSVQNCLIILIIPDQTLWKEIVFPSVLKVN